MALLRHESVRVFLVLSALILVFMAKPITTSGFYAPGDVFQQAGLHGPASIPQANWTGDVSVDILPWTMFDRKEVRAGRLPLWNPYNGSGVPHLANMQSAVFSPFTIPFYVLPFRAALLASAYLLLLTAGLLMYGLARHLRLCPAAALVGAITFTYCAYIVYWLRYPLASAAVFLPGLLWAASALVRAERRAAACRWGAMFAVIVACGVFSGHPETLFFGLLPALTWSIGWLASQRLPLRTMVGRLVRLGVAGVVGLGLAAVQVLPFLEYVSRSPAGVSRGGQLYQSPSWAVANLFPLFAGSPSMSYSGPYSIIHPFYEATDIYVGLLALFLAGIGLASSLWTRRRAPLAFAAMGVAWLLYGYNAGGLGGIVSRLPGFSLTLAARGVVVWELCVAVLAAYGVQGLIELGRRHVTGNRWVPGALIGGAAVCLLGAGVVLVRHARYTVGRPFFRSLNGVANAVALHHVLFLGATFLVGVAAAAALTVLHRPRAVWAACGVLALIVFLQSGYMFRNVDTTVDLAHFYPVPPAARQVAARVGKDQTLWVEGAHLRPDLNLWYPLSSPGSYDALGLQAYDTVYRKLMRPPTIIPVGGVGLGLLDGPVSPLRTSALAAIGIRHVVTDRPFPLATPVGSAVPGEVTPNGHVTFTTSWSGPAPDVWVVSAGSLRPGETAVLTIAVPGRPSTTTTARSAAGEVAFSPVPAGPADATSAVLGLRVTAPDGATHVLPAASIQGYRTPLSGLVLAQVSDGVRVFDVPGSTPRYFSPSSTRWVSSGAQARAVVTAPGFEPSQVAVLEGKRTAPTAGGPGTVTVVSEQPDSMRLRVTRDQPGWVVVNQNDYPGWVAAVNGHGRPVVRANSTFMAVPVPAGESVVELHFRPRSVQVGAWVSIASLLVIVAALLVAWRSRRATARVPQAPPG
jgi:hypothetical protein